MTVAKLVVEAPPEQRFPEAPVTGTFPLGPVIVKSEPSAAIELHNTDSEKFKLK